MDYVLFSKRFFAATGIPVNLLEEGKPIYSSIGEMLGYMPQESWPLYPQTRNPEFSTMSPDIEYGHVKIEGTAYDLFLGPIFTAPVNEALIHEYFAEFSVPEEFRENLTEMLYGLPVGSHPHFLRYLAFLHLVLNHKDLAVDEFYSEDAERLAGRRHRETETQIEAKEEEKPHGSYDFEMRMYGIIAQGDPDRLKRFFDGMGEAPREGSVAHTPLRQAKNIFIGLAAKAVMLGAIPGGMDVEKAYQLVDLYTAECEKLQSLEEVDRLRYIMLMDLTQRVGEARLPEGLTPDIRQSMSYIRSRTNGILTVEEVAEAIHRSPSYLMHRFRKETGMSVGDYMTRCKMEEAAAMLRHSRRSLADISAYLGYSSQSYFQTVFKKQYGVTPLQYRKGVEGPGDPEA